MSYVIIFLLCRKMQLMVNAGNYMNLIEIIDFFVYMVMISTYLFNITVFHGFSYIYYLLGGLTAK